MTTSASRTTDSAVATVARRAARVRRPSLTRLVAYGILLVVALAILFPLLYAVLGGFKTNGELMADPGRSSRRNGSSRTTSDVLFGEYAPTFWRQARNSVIVATVAVVLTVSLASAAAFVFARMRFRGREALYRCSCSVCCSPRPSRSCRCTS